MDGGYLEFSCRTRIVREAGAWNAVGREAARLGVRRALVVADPFLAQTDVLARADASLAENGVEKAGLWTECPPDSDVAVVERLAALLKERRADGIVAVGGGSALDTAKAANIVHTLGGRLRDHEGAGVLPDRLGPILAAPTTAGTGSEVSFAATVKDRETHEKILFYAPSLACDVAILDPELTAGLPSKLTAATGADALTHAVEAMLAVNANPFTDALADAAIRLVVRHLPTAVREGGDLEARGAMLLAAAAGGMAFSNAGVGIVHAMAHAVGAHFPVHHGTANAILLPHGAGYNLAAVPDRAAGLARAFGVPEDSVVDAIRRLLAECGLPARLEEVGVARDQVTALAEYALTDGSMAFNPVPPAPEDVEALLRAAM